MKENDVAYISKQFGIDQDIVEASVNDGTLGQRLQDAMKEKVTYSNDEFEKFKTNYKAEVVNSYFADLVEKAKKGDLPQDLYTPIKGAAYQQLERELAKEYKIDEYKDVRDLVQRAIKTSANGKSANSEEIEKQIQELKNANLKLQSERDEAVKTVEQKYRTMSIEKDMRNILESVPFDFSGLKSDEIDGAKKRTQTMLKSLFDHEYALDYNDNGNLVVKKGDEIIKNSATLEPLSADEVFVNLAKEYNLKLKSPDTGGQGGTSSGRSVGQYESLEAFEADMAAKGIALTDPKYIENFKKSGLHKLK